MPTGACCDLSSQVLINSRRLGEVLPKTPLAGLEDGSASHCQYLAFQGLGYVQPWLEQDIWGFLDAIMKPGVLDRCFARQYVHPREQAQFARVSTCSLHITASLLFCIEGPMYPAGVWIM